MNCPHCGAKIEGMPRVHWAEQGNIYYAACGARNLQGRRAVIFDRSRVTCLSCQKTRAFKEAP